MQRRPFTSDTIPHGSQRHAQQLFRRLSRTARISVARQHVVTSAMDWQAAIENVRQQVQKQKTAVVLGAFGVLASGLTLAGNL